MVDTGTSTAPVTTDVGRNWAGNHVYRAERLHRPRTLAELQRVAATTPRLRVLGSRHTFTDIADAPDLVSVEDLDTGVEVNATQGTVTVPAAMTYGALADALRPEGLALANLASLPHICVAGAVATATHGSGVANGNLAVAVAGLEMVTSSGDVVRTVRGDPDFDGLVVHLGAVGVVTRVSLDVEPAYEVSQSVFDGLTWETLAEHLDDVLSAGYSVSVFSRLGRTTDHVWVKRRTDEPGGVGRSLFGAPAATGQRHPITGTDPVHATPQLGEPGPWDHRLPHFRMGFTPSKGEELQSEWHVDRTHAVAAIDALRGVADVVRPVLQVNELRTVAADTLWLSPQYGQDTLSMHFTWSLEPEHVRRAVTAVEDALAPFAPRPHWGKVFTEDPDSIAARYDRRDDFLALVARMDPRGAFRNDWFARVIGEVPR